MADQPVEVPRSVAGDSERRRRLVVAGAVVLALLAGLGVWALVRDGDEEEAPAAPVGKPVVLTEAELREFGRAQATPVYWAGAHEGTTYELTRSAGGQIYIRYLVTVCRPGTTARGSSRSGPIRSRPRTPR